MALAMTVMFSTFALSGSAAIWRTASATWLASIMGSGATRRFSAVRWGMARSIVTAWVLTFPAAGLAAALCFLILNPFLG